MPGSRRRRKRRSKRKRIWDDIPPLRYPITSAQIRTDMLGVFIRRAELKTWVGRRDPVSLTAVVTQGVTALEQFTRLMYEEQLDRRGWKGGESHAVVGVRGEDGDVRVSKSRLAAIGRTFQSVKPILEMAEECGLAPLKRCVEALKDDLEGMFGLRHDLTHALASGRFEVENFLNIIWQVMRAGLEGRPMYVAAALLIEASIMEAAGRADGAREAAEEALEICDGVLEGVPEGGDDDDVRQARVCRAHALARLRRTGEAEEAYREAAEKSPRDVLPLVGMGHLLVQAGRPEEAVEWYARAVAVDPDHVAARTSMGHALAVVRGADGTRSVQCYQDAMRGGFDDVSLRAGYGTALAMAGRYEEAAGQYRRAIELDPGDAAACVGLGNALAALKRHGDAVGMYEEGIRLGIAAVPVRDEVLGEESEAGIFALGLGGAAAHRGLGNALIETGSPERAAVALGRAASLDPGSIGAQTGSGGRSTCAGGTRRRFAPGSGPLRSTRAASRRRLGSGGLSTCAGGTRRRFAPGSGPLRSTTVASGRRRGSAMRSTCAGGTRRRFAPGSGPLRSTRAASRRRLGSGGRSTCAGGTRRR